MLLFSLAELTALLRIRLEPGIQAGPYDVDIVGFDHSQSPAFVTRFRVVARKGRVAIKCTDCVLEWFRGLRSWLEIWLFGLYNSGN